MGKRKDGRFQKSININGKRIYFYGKTEKEILNKIMNYREKEKNGLTFKEVADRWEREHYEEVADTTAKRYKPCCQRAVEYFGNEFIKDISISKIDAYIKAFAKKGFAFKTVKAQLSIISLIFRYAVLNGYVENNPCAYVSVPKNLKQTRRELPEANQIEIVNKSVNVPFGLFAYFILYTGCRRGEALALQYGDIDFDNKIIHITKSVSYANNSPKIKTPKTEAGIRDIILLDCLAEKIPKGKKNEYIFSSGNGKLLHGSNFERLWRKYTIETGLTITPHQLRHAYATILYEAGIKDKDAQELMGHSNINITREIYTHISSRRKEETAELLNNFINNDVK